MKRGLLWTLLLSLFGMGGLWSVHAITFNSSSYSVNGSIGDSISGGQGSTSYKLISTGGESIAGSGSSGSYKLGQGYVPMLQNSLQLTTQLNGLAGYYSFDEGNGTRIYDSSINQRDGDTQGAPTWNPSGKVAGALSFNGSSQYATVPSFNINSTITYAAWVYPTSASQSASIISKHSGTTDSQALLGLTGGTLFSVLTTGGNGPFLYGPTLPVNTWSYVAVTYDGTNSHIFVNGAEYASKPQTGAIATNSFLWTFGRDAQSSVNYLAGSVDEAKIFNRALSADEIKAEYDAGSAGLASGLGLGTVTPGTSRTSSFDSAIETSSPGYTLAINQNNNLTRSGGGTIAGVTGSIAAPVTWNEGVTKGLGFTLYGTNATAIPGLWGSGAAYAAIPGSATSFYNRDNSTGGAKDILNMRLRLDTTASQAGGDYTNRMILTGTMKP